MKLKLIFPTGLFVAVATLSMGAQAASSMDTAEPRAPAANNQQPTVNNQQATANNQDDKAASQKKHSHVEDKAGVRQQALETSSDKANAYKDKTKHFHPRDMK